MRIQHLSYSYDAGVGSSLHCIAPYELPSFGYATFGRLTFTSQAASRFLLTPAKRSPHFLAPEIKNKLIPKHFLKSLLRYEYAKSDEDCVDCR